MIRSLTATRFQSREGVASDAVPMEASRICCQGSNGHPFRTMFPAMRRSNAASHDSTIAAGAPSRSRCSLVSGRTFL